MQRLPQEKKKIQKKVTRVIGHQVFLRWQQHKRRRGVLPSAALLLGLCTHVGTVSQDGNLGAGLDSGDAAL